MTDNPDERRPCEGCGYPVPEGGAPAFLLCPDCWADIRAAQPTLTHNDGEDDDPRSTTATTTTRSTP